MLDKDSYRKQDSGDENERDLVLQAMLMLVVMLMLMSMATRAFVMMMFV